MSAAQPTSSVLIPAHERPATLARCLESVLSQRPGPLEVVVHDDASPGGPLRERVPEKFAGSARWLRTSPGRGVAAARNTLADAARGDLLVFLDDDMHLAEPDALQRLVAPLARDERIGLVATTIVDRSQDPPRDLVPFGRLARWRDPSLEQREGPAAYFLGGCHAVRARAMTACGGYDEAFVFGEEELDLAYKLVRRGQTMAFVPGRFAVHDPPPTRGAAHPDRRGQRIENLARNRLVLAARHLPLRYAVPYVAAWSLRHGAHAVRHRAFGAWVRGFASGVQAAAETERRPLDAETIAYLRRSHGRLWY